MFKVKTFIFILFCFTIYCHAQNTIPELQQFNNNILFNVWDTTCINLTGEWTGEEIQYDVTQSYIKFKFKVIFRLKQEGNRVYGTSYIEDKFRGSYGDMKIRGIIIGNKLHFEEYAILDEKIFQKNMAWCLRSGEMTIKTGAKAVWLEGLSYNGYASDTYVKCTDYVKMSLSKTLVQSNSRIANKDPEKTELLLFPNPSSGPVTIAYTLKESTLVRIDVYSLSGARIDTVLNEQVQEGNQQIAFNLTTYVPGVYLVVLQAGNSYSTKQLVKTK